MQNIKQLIILMFAVILNSTAYAHTNNKVLVVSSYGTDYNWSNSIIDEINYQLKSNNLDIEVATEYLSSERLTDINKWGSKVNSFLSEYEGCNIKAIVLISDEAWMAFRQTDNKKFKDTPIVLCAVKPHTISIDEYRNNIQNLQLSQFSETLDVMKEYKATGVLRETNITGYINLMLSVKPDIDRLALITDNRFYGIYVRLLFEKIAKEKHPEYPIEFIDSRFTNTDSLLSRLPNITENTGVLLTSWLTGKNGFTYSKKYVYKEMTTKMKAPVFITTDIGLDQGWFLGGVFNSSKFWGEETAEMLINIINGRDPIDIAPLLYRDEQININVEVLSKFKLSKKRLPKDTIYINNPLSTFSRYKTTIISIILLLVVTTTLSILIFKRNVKLKKTQKQLLISIGEIDYTNQRLNKMKEELTIALEKAKEADRLKSSFVANMGAQIRNPLNAIVGFSGLISIMEEKSEREEMAVLIKQNSDTLSHLVTSILDISLLESRNIRFNKDETNPKGICEDLISAYKNITQIPIKLVAPEVDIVINTDRQRLAQALSSLLDNAVKFTENKTIELGYFEYSDTQIEFYVKDYGIGIPSEMLNLVFDSFVKVNPYSAGAGLGLAIVKNIVIIMGGEIGVTSKINDGSHFWFRIPKK